MSRPRAPILIDGAPIEMDAPGLKIVRGDQLYWSASRTKIGKRALARGYTTKTVRIHIALDNVDAVRRVERRCQHLQMEMKTWFDDPRDSLLPEFDGSLSSLINCYQRDPESPYHSLKEISRRSYNSWMKQVDIRYGKRVLSRLQGRDFRRWYHEMMQPARKGEPPRLRQAKGCIRQMLPILFGYGAENGMEPCGALYRMMGDMIFRVPDDMMRRFRDLRPQKMAMTFEHAQGIVRTAIARGSRRDRALAIGVAAQFEFTMRQIDVIGYWEKITGKQTVGRDSIVAGGKVWFPGLRYEDIKDGLLDLSTSKTRTQAIYEISGYPLFLEALEAIPECERTGPLVCDERGRPLNERQYYHLYTKVAGLAGVPPEVWNTRARHGGVTEARASGADAVDTKEHAQHSNISTTLKHYAEATVEATRRVATSRVKLRKANKDRASDKGVA